MNSRDLDALIELLEQERVIYDEMAGVLEQEREAMLKLAVSQLGALASRKETLALRIKALDESRKMLARRLGAACGLRHDEVTVSALGEYAPAEPARRLKAVARALRETVERCQEINRFNERAAQRGMELTGKAVDFLIAQADPVGKVYQPPARKTRSGYATAGPASSGPGFISRQA